MRVAKTWNNFAVSFYVEANLELHRPGYQTNLDVLFHELIRMFLEQKHKSLLIRAYFAINSFQIWLKQKDHLTNLYHFNKLTLLTICQSNICSMLDRKSCQSKLICSKQYKTCWTEIVKQVFNLETAAFKTIHLQSSRVSERSLNEMGWFSLITKTIKC